MLLVLHSHALYWLERVSVQFRNISQMIGQDIPNFRNLMSSVASLWILIRLPLVGFNVYQISVKSEVCLCTDSFEIIIDDPSF